MRTVWKYTLEWEEEQTLQVPLYATCLDVAEQNGLICLWVEVDTTQPKTPRQVVIVGTGNPAPEKAFYLGTAHFPDRGLVFHAYERTP